MPVSLTSCTFGINGVASLADGTLSIHTPSDPVQIGSGGFAALSWSLDDGDGPGQANQMVVKRFTVPAGGSVLLDLSDGSLENFRGEPVTLSAVKLFVLAVVEPDGVRRVLVGPQGVADGAQLWFPGTGAEAAEEVFQATIHPHPDAGWPVSVTGGSVLEIHAPEVTGGDVEVNLLVIGVDS